MAGWLATGLYSTQMVHEVVQIVRNAAELSGSVSLSCQQVWRERFGGRRCVKASLRRSTLRHHSPATPPCSTPRPSWRYYGPVLLW
ncbi:hypothetical protein E2C01_064529 [Portunus trituberculatus]|uniref:Uncharacterized protein n=1 Tax=Portunus trituberculatus TaxID=210409 RepID=A0A5B7HL29_PORTR|nr:hypothetical protein [Portunus trituberculatus]